MEAASEIVSNDQQQRKRRRLSEESQEAKRKEKEEKQAIKEALRQEKEKAKAAKDAKKTEEAAKKEQLRIQKEAARQEKEAKRLKEEAEKQQKRLEKEAFERKKQAAAEKQASIMCRFLQSKKEKETTEIDDGVKSSQETPVVDAAIISSTMDMHLTGDELLNADDLRRMHLNSWKSISKQKNVNGRWGLRRNPKVEAVRELKLHSENQDVSTLVKDSGNNLQSTGDCSLTEVTNVDQILPSQDTFEVERIALQHRKKLLQFHKCFRPAYYGTFSRRSNCVKPRCPLRKDSSLDYEIDSDDEWEEEEPGENTSVCDEEAEEEEKLEGGDEESADGFMVPNGYLSENEGIEIECDRTATSCRASEGVLSIAVKEALKSNCPLVVTNFGNGISPLCKTSIAIVESLRIEMLRDDIWIEMPNDKDVDDDDGKEFPGVKLPSSYLKVT